MRKIFKKGTASVLSAALLLTGTAGIFPQQALQNAAVIVNAAEDDLPWSTYLKNDDAWFGTSEAIAVADQCIQYQVSGEGGWQKGMLTSHTGDWAHSTIDNDATTSQIRFLMRTYKATGQQKYLDCALRGVDCLFKMQYANGGYMQNCNNPGTYHAHITLNDGAYVHVMEIMKEMSTKSGDFTAVSDEYAQKGKDSLEKAVQCLLDMQITVNGVKTAWCQQHDENTLAPAGARAYELPSICTSESAGVITFLYNMAKETGRSDLIESVNAAITWFKKVALYGIKFDWNSDKTDKVVTQVDGAGPIWARFYTLDTEVPMFSDRDGGTYYDVSQISQERRTGYAWYGSWGKNIINLALLEGGTTTTPSVTTPSVTTTTAPVQEPEYSGQYISNLTVHDTANGANWSIAWNLGVGSPIYGDRDFTFVTVPDELVGAEYVKTACDSKYTSGDLASLTAAHDITLYALVDLRLSAEQGIKPAWLSGWTQTNLTANTSNTVTFEIYSRRVAEGETVTLGSNGSSTQCVNYLLAAQLIIPEITTTTAEAAATTTTTTAASEETPKKFTGDLDCNGVVALPDAVMLAKAAAGVGETLSSEARMNAECDGKDGINGGDLAVLLQFIAGTITEFPC